MAKKYLYINDTRIEGIYISSDTYLNSPAFDYSEFQIPGRDGNVILDNKRMGNVIRRFDCYIPETGNVETALRDLKSILYNNRGYLKIASDYDPGFYQYGYLAEGLEVSPFDQKTASFSLYFSCLPKIFDSSTEAYQTDNDIGVSLYVNRFKSNNDSELIAFQSQLKNDYPYSPIGWIYGSRDSSDYLTEGSTYTINVSSPDTQKYVVLLGKLSNWTTPQLETTFDVICEVSNYEANNISFTVPTEGYPDYIVSFATPVLFNDANIEATWTGGHARLYRSNMITASSNKFTSLTSVGSQPIFVYKKMIDSTHINDGAVPYDLFALNDGRFYLDFVSMANDLGRQFIYDNYVINDEMYVYLDFAGKKAYLLDSESMEGNRIADVSAYFKCFAETLFGYSFDVRYGAIYEWTGGGSLPYYIWYGIDGKITFNMNWWKI